MPTYNGIFPAVNGKTTQAANPKAVYGSWFVHLLPFVEQQSLFDQILDDVTRFSNTGNPVSSPATGTLVTPAQSAMYDYSNSTYVPANYSEWEATKQWVPGGTPSNGNGYVIEPGGYWAPAKTPDPGTGGWFPPPTLISPATPAVYEPPGSGPTNGFVNIWNPTARSAVFNGMLCPSDLSVGSETQVTRGKVYVTSGGPWPSTNYLGNWNVFSDGNRTAGYTAPPGNFQRVSTADGMSNTIMFAEAYAWCDGRGRNAYLAWFPSNGLVNPSRRGVHNFGITFSLSSSTLVVDDAEITDANANGYPNPDSQLNMMFQIKPATYPASRCPAGKECCNVLTVQSGHTVLNVAMMDGSVRSVSRGVSEETWRRAMVPDDGETLGSDW